MSELAEFITEVESCLYEKRSFLEGINRRRAKLTDHEIKMLEFRIERLGRLLRFLQKSLPPKDAAKLAPARPMEEIPPPEQRISPLENAEPIDDF